LPEDFAFLLGISYAAILLSLHLADLLSTDRRWRDGIKTRRQTARQKGDALAGVGQIRADQVRRCWKLPRSRSAFSPASPKAPT